MTARVATLVLGSWSSLPARQLEPFSHSLRATGFAGTFSLLLGRHDLADRKAFGSLADEVIHAEASYEASPRVVRNALAHLRTTRGLRRFYEPGFRLASGFGRSSASRWRSLEFDLEGLQTLRYLHYYRAILAADPPPESVMLTDLRDVLFQRDPFAEPVEELELYLEDFRIGEETFNTRWLRQLYGETGLSAMRGRAASCSGTVVGPRNAMLAYLAEMAIELSRFRRVMGPRDQAVHNMLLYGGRLPARVVPNGLGRVLTLGGASEFRFDDRGLLANADGRAAAVLHQWDRHPRLVPHLEKIGLLDWSGPA